MNRGLAIPFEVADAITLASLKDQRVYLLGEIEAWKKGQWMHPEDVVRNQQLIPMLEVLIEYYGGHITDEQQTD